MRFSETVLDWMLTRCVHLGTLAVRRPSGHLKEYGNGSPPHVGLSIRTPSPARRLGLNPALAPGECYVDDSMTMAMPRAANRSTARMTEATFQSNQRGE